MSKYEPLANYLASLNMEVWRPSFTDIERILDSGLPPSARQYPEWWANQEKGSQSQSWQSAGYVTQDLDLGAERVTFRRFQHNTLSKQPAHQLKPALNWDVPDDYHCELEFSWTPVGAVVLDNKRLLVFPVLPEHPGLYRMRIQRIDGAKARYVGETDNLRRRFGHYRNPGPTQQTNIRINKYLVDAIEQGAEVTLSIITDQAWITQTGPKQAADFSRKALRRLFENFAQIVEDDVEDEDLNR
jgi:hypothetical protein